MIFQPVQAYLPSSETWSLKITPESESERQIFAKLRKFLNADMRKSCWSMKDAAEPYVIRRKYLSKYTLFTDHNTRRELLIYTPTLENIKKLELNVDAALFELHPEVHPLLRSLLPTHLLEKLADDIAWWFERSESGAMIITDPHINGELNLSKLPSFLDILFNFLGLQIGYDESEAIMSHFLSRQAISVKITHYSELFMDKSMDEIYFEQYMNKYQWMWRNAEKKTNELRRKFSILRKERQEGKTNSLMTMNIDALRNLSKMVETRINVVESAIEAFFNEKLLGTMIQVALGHSELSGLLKRALHSSFFSCYRICLTMPGVKEGFPSKLQKDRISKCLDLVEAKLELKCSELRSFIGLELHVENKLLTTIKSTLTLREQEKVQAKVGSDVAENELKNPPKYSPECDILYDVADTKNYGGVDILSKDQNNNDNSDDNNNYNNNNVIRFISRLNQLR